MIATPFNLIIQVASSLLSVPQESIAPYFPMVAPLPTSLAQIKRRSQIDALLEDQRFWGEDAGFNFSSEEKVMVDGKFCMDDADLSGVSKSDGIIGLSADYQKRPSTYGEITSLGARQLFYNMRMYSDRSYGLKENENDIVFFDLGSGVGRLVVQSYLELQSRIKKSIGVEMVPSRHEIAIQTWQKILAIRNIDGLPEVEHTMVGKKSDERDKCGVEFHEGDLFEIDVTEATHIFVSSLCFTYAMMIDLASKLQSEASQLKCVATLQKFPEGLFGSQLPFMEYVEMSWTKGRGQGCLVYFYFR